MGPSAYMVSRGLAKAGNRSRAYDPREDVDLGRGESEQMGWQTTLLRVCRGSRSLKREVE
jgi:hypothetical protein